MFGSWDDDCLRMRQALVRIVDGVGTLNYWRGNTRASCEDEEGKREF